MTGPAELNKRIRTVQSISKMTRAMQLISGVKMRRAKRLLAQALPYTIHALNTMRHLLEASAEAHELAKTSPYLHYRDKKPGDTWRAVVYVMTGDRGLAGDYNRELADIAIDWLDQRKDALIALGYHPEFDVRVTGRMGRDLLAQAGYEPASDFVFSIGEPTFYGASDLAERMLELYDQRTADELTIIYSMMRSPISSTPMYTTLLPANTDALAFMVDAALEDPEVRCELPENFDATAATAYDMPDDIRTLLSYLLTTYMSATLYGAMVEAYASEQTQRMTSMDSASRNSAELMTRLDRERNRLRQQGITTELTEIASAAEAMKE